jgi:phage terminase large subunit GpA-like protein
VRGHPVRYWFKPSGKRNEALDRRVYALAALYARPVPLGGTLARRANRVVVFDKLLRERVNFQGRVLHCS